jgi:hypothetical protein
VSTPPAFLIGRHPDRGLLWASIDPSARFLAAEIAQQRFAAYLAPFTSEDAARAALTAAGAERIEIEERRRGKRRG